jgi:predicted O-linked N-acetylglucosamine transferase (SPINDLY family)
MNDPRTKIESGVKLQQAGKNAEAAVLYRQVLAKDRNHPDALHLLGLIEFQLGKREAGIEMVRRSINLRPMADACDNLGLLLATAGQAERAIEMHRRAIELNPRHVKALHNLANLLHHANRLEEAVSAYQATLALQPNWAEALQNLGTTLQKMKRSAEAEVHLRRAIVLKPEMPDAHNNLGTIYSSRNQVDEAIAEFELCLKYNRDFAPALSNLGAALRLRRRHPEAIAALKRAVELQPNMAEGHNNLGITLKEVFRLEEAIEAFKKALAIRPDLMDAWNNLGNAYKDGGKVPEAAAAYSRSLSIRNSDPRAFIDATYPGVHSNLVYTLEFHPDYDDESLLREQRRFNELYALPLKSKIRPFEHDRNPDRRLRIGYVSPYFYKQAESFFVLPLLEHHDHQNFEIHCYSSVIRPDPTTDQTRQCADGWHDVRTLNDEELAQKLRADRIDVLVDLAMHMAHNRLLTFARKPSPVQVCWLAYPGGTGLDTMDYRLTDRFLNPPDQPMPAYTEESIYLPDIWCCYAPLEEIEVQVIRKEGPITFGSINNPCKLNEALLELWSKVLHAVPGARLLLQAISEEHRDELRRSFQKLEIQADRLIFTQRAKRTEYLHLYDQIDIALDPLPYNGITTTCDALWMGVPVVTLVGKTAAGRAGHGLLSQVGLEELVARDEESFVKLAAGLAGDAARLAELRRTLRERMRTSPLTDGKRFARNMETAYRQMWRRWCAKDS